MANVKQRRTAMKEVQLGKMVVLEIAQRRRDNSWVDYLLNDFDLDQIGFPILSERGGRFFIIDGQHRIEALKHWLGEGWETQKIACKVYQDLTEKDEAELFLRYNDIRQVRIYDKFNVGVTARRPEEVEIKKVVEAQGLHISASKTAGGIGCVGTLRKSFKRGGSENLGRSLRIIRDAYGETGFEASVIDGVGHLCVRYNGTLDEEYAKQRLGAARGGMNGLLNRAHEIKLKTGNAMGLCVAAAAVGIINAGRGGGKKLPSWWEE